MRSHPTGVGQTRGNCAETTIAATGRHRLYAAASDRFGNTSAVVDVRTTVTIDGKRITVATRTVRLRAKRSAKVALTVTAAARRRLGREPRALAITATPLGAEAGRPSRLRLTLKG